MAKTRQYWLKKGGRAPRRISTALAVDLFDNPTLSSPGSGKALIIFYEPGGQ